MRTLLLLLLVGSLLNAGCGRSRPIPTGLPLGTGTNNEAIAKFQRAMGHPEPKLRYVLNGSKYR